MEVDGTRPEVNNEY